MEIFRVHHGFNMTTQNTTTQVDKAQADKALRAKLEDATAKGLPWGPILREWKAADDAKAISEAAADGIRRY